MEKQKTIRKITVLGTGGWGTALALVLHSKGHNVTLWGSTPDYVESLKEQRENKKYLKGIEIPHDLKITSDIESTQEQVDLIVVAIPTPYVRKTLQPFKNHYIPGTPIVSVIKGIENETLMGWDPSGLLPGRRQASARAHLVSPGQGHRSVAAARRNALSRN